MVPTSTCPDARKWQPLLLGRLPESEMEALGQHLAECGVCLQTIRGVQADDTVVEAMRFQAKTAEPISERVQGLIQRLKGMPRQAVAATCEEATLGLAPPAGEITQEWYDFLAPAQAPDELGRLGPYRILKVLGAGGMGIVFQAEDVQLQRQVALKVMKAEAAQKPSARERFLREARAAAALEHENIVTIYHVGEERGVPFLAMQWLKGMSLAERLTRPGPLTVPQVLRLGRHIARGLQAAHAHGLIHRDIKPANLWLETRGQEPGVRGQEKSQPPLIPDPCLLTPDFRVKILDFGLARPVEGGAHLTQTGAIVGSPAYMAPEQGRGLPVDHRADLFSLGCVLYQMLTGQRPFAGADTMAILSSLALDTPAAPHTLNPQCPPALSRLVMRLLEKDPTKRPASAREVVAALSELESTQSEPRTQRGFASEVSGPGTDVTSACPKPLTPKTPCAARQAWPRRLLVAATVLLALSSLGYFFGGQIIRVVTNQGELVIMVDDETVEIKIVRNGVVLQQKTSKREFTLTAGKGEIEVVEKDGIKLATKKFELTRGGKTTVSVTLQELADARKPKDPDRRAAEWVLSIGGYINIKENGKQREIRAVGDLSRGAFELWRVHLNFGTVLALRCRRPGHPVFLLRPRASADGLANNSRSSYRSAQPTGYHPRRSPQKQAAETSPSSAVGDFGEPPRVGHKNLRQPLSKTSATLALARSWLLRLFAESLKAGNRGEVPFDLRNGHVFSLQPCFSNGKMSRERRADKWLVRIAGEMGTT